MISPNHRAASDRVLIGFITVFGLFVLWSFSLAWNESILDRHEFRQVQTALSAQWLVETGWKLDYETPLFGPPWSIPIEFPLYQTCVAALTSATGLPLESAGRAVSVLFLLATMPAVYLLSGLFGHSRSRRFLVVATILSSPIYLFYGRTVMIETCALCFSGWFLVSIGFAARDKKPLWAVAAALFGVLAALAKVTTFAVYCFPAGALALWLAWPQLAGRERSLTQWIRISLLCAAPVALAVFIASWWVSYSDAIKQSNPYSGFLISDQMTPWIWGTWDQRFSMEVWSRFGDTLSQFLFSEISAAIILIGATFVSSGQRRVAALAGLTFMMGPLLFVNLYYQHDYYYAANTLLLLFGAGIILVGVWDSVKLSSTPKIAIIGLFFAAQLLTFYRGYSYNYRRTLPSPPEIATLIRSITPPEDVIVVYGWDWNALVPYYAQRRAIMIPQGRDYELKTLDDVLQNMPSSQQISGMLIRTTATPATPEFITNRTERFGLNAVPIATSPDGDFYVRPDLSKSAQASLAEMTFKTVTINPHASAVITPVELLEAEPSDFNQPFFTPLPIHAKSQFGLTRAKVDGYEVLLTHPRSSLFFGIPSEASQVQLKAGISSAAYRKGDPSITDGILVRIILHSSNGTSQVLLSRHLDPVLNKSDRGLQVITCALPESPAGELEIQLTPGPLGNLSNDWAYLAGVTIK